MSHLIHDVLKKYWGYSDFRPLQKDVIKSILERKDTVAIFPTGGGKSICFQIPILLQEGICIIISPLISLMQEQVSTLKNRNISAVALCGSIPDTETERILNNAIYNAYKFLYLAPEKFENRLVFEKLKQMNIRYIAIDEAHCISSWGKDFRPKYKSVCSELKNWFNNIPLIALTASTKPNDLQEITKILKLKEPQIFRRSLLRNNLAYFVYKTDNKRDLIQKIIKKNTPKGSVIIYTRTTSNCDSICNQLIADGFSANRFHGKISESEKKELNEKWNNNQIHIMVATSAFGMGIDKANVRAVIHWDISYSLEDYFQESGRAGRDGKKAFAVALYDDDDIENLTHDSYSDYIDISDLKSFFKLLSSHLQIALGEQPTRKLSLNPTEFQIKYNYSPFHFNLYLKTLERNEILSVTKNSTEITFRLLYPPHIINNFLKDNPQYKTLLTFIMRNFTGVFTQKQTANIHRLSKQLGISKSTLTQSLKSLEKESIVELESFEESLIIEFLVRRDDDRTINAISSNIKELNQIKKQQAINLLKYLTNHSECKQNQLIAYFNEKIQQNCGICSYCYASIKKNKLELENTILNQLTEKPHSMAEIMQKNTTSKELIEQIIRQLLENNKIRLINGKLFI